MSGRQPGLLSRLLSGGRPPSIEEGSAPPTEPPIDFDLDVYYRTRDGKAAVIKEIDRSYKEIRLRGFVVINSRHLEYSWTRYGFGSFIGHPYDLMPGPSFADIADKRIAELESEVARLQQGSVPSPRSEGQRIISQVDLGTIRGTIDDINDAIETLHFLARTRLNLQQRELDRYRNSISFIAHQVQARLVELDQVYDGVSESAPKAT